MASPIESETSGYWGLTQKRLRSKKIMGRSKPGAQKTPPMNVDVLGIGKKWLKSFPRGENWSPENRQGLSKGAMASFRRGKNGGLGFH